MMTTPTGSGRCSGRGRSTWSRSGARSPVWRCHRSGPSALWSSTARGPPRWVSSPPSSAARRRPFGDAALDRVGAVPHHLELLPAVDIAGGQAVQLVQGVAGSEKRFGDPVEAALRWQNAGAEWIHLVDLDAAFGRGHNRALLAAIVGRVDVHVELSGGVRDDESLAAAMATG